MSTVTRPEARPDTHPEPVIAIAPTTEPVAPPPTAPTPAPEAPRGSKKKFVLPLVAVLAVGAGTWGVRQYTYGRAHESTDNAQVDGHIVPVLAKVGGYVRAVNVAENQAVREGQSLTQIDDQELRVKLAQTEADLAAAQAASGGRGQAQSQVLTAESQTAAGRAQVLAAQATLDRTRSDYRRFQQLAAQQIISQQNLDAARAAVAVAEAQVAAAQRQAAAQGASVGGAEAGVRLAEARLAGARATVDNARLQLSYTKVAAPVSGTVARKAVEVGQLVQPGQTLLSVVADTGVYVTANFKETQLVDLKVGQPVEIDVDAYGGAKAEGVVESISGASGAKFALLPPDNATGNFTKVVQRVPVRVRITRGLGAARPLRPGMSVEAHVTTRQ